MKHTMNLTRGSVFKQLVTFSVPILLTNLLQQLYHAADVMVVGRFAANSEVALAAVGSTGAITTLLLNVFIGLAVGANVVCANFYGAGKQEELRQASSTAILLGLVSGVFISVVGYFSTGQLLLWMDSPPEVIEDATTYMQIIFLGQPGSLTYNFCAGILRSHGDTRRPMYILAATGLVNVVLNMILVIGFHLDSAGVAIATIAAHYLSAAAALWILFHDTAEFGLHFSSLRFYKARFLEILRVGIPGGLNGAVFSISNVIVTGTVNTFGAEMVAARSAASSLTNITYQPISSMYSAVVSFVGQNYGAKRFDRIRKAHWYGMGIAALIIFLVALVTVLFPDFFLGIFTDDAHLIDLALPYLYLIGFGYCLCALSEVTMASSRGMGKSMVPTVLNAFFVCIPRILWVLLLFPMRPTFTFLILCYPISWAMAATAQNISFRRYFRIEKKKYESSLDQSAPLE